MRYHAMIKILLLIIILQNGVNEARLQPRQNKVAATLQCYVCENCGDVEEQRPDMQMCGDNMVFEQTTKRTTTTIKPMVTSSVINNANEIMTETSKKPLTTATDYEEYEEYNEKSEEEVKEPETAGKGDEEEEYIESDEQREDLGDSNEKDPSIRTIATTTTTKKPTLTTTEKPVIEKKTSSPTTTLFITNTPTTTKPITSPTIAANKLTSTETFTPETTSITTLSSITTSVTTTPPKAIPSIISSSASSNTPTLTSSTTTEPIILTTIAIPTTLSITTPIKTSTPSLTTTYSTKESTEYEDYYEEYEEPDTEVLLDITRQGRQLTANDHVCFTIELFGNTTVVTNRGCATLIRNNKYLTCQSLSKGLPIRNCRLCNKDGCNDYDSDWMESSSPVCKPYFWKFGILLSIYILAFLR